MNRERGQFGRGGGEKGQRMSKQGTARKGGDEDDDDWEDINTEVPLYSNVDYTHDMIFAPAHHGGLAIPCLSTIHHAAFTASVNAAIPHLLASMEEGSPNQGLGFSYNNSIITATLSDEAFKVFSDRDATGKLPSLQERVTGLIPHLQMALSKIAYDIRDEAVQAKMESSAKRQFGTLADAKNDIRRGIINCSYLRVLNSASREKGFEFITDPQYRGLSTNRGYVSSLPFPDPDHMLELYRIRICRPARLLFELANGHIDDVKEIGGCKNCKPRGQGGVEKPTSQPFIVSPYLIHIIDCKYNTQATHHHHKVKDMIASLLRQLGLAVKVEALPSFIHGTSTSPPKAGDVEMKSMDIVAEQVPPDILTLLNPQSANPAVRAGNGTLFIDNTKNNPISMLMNSAPGHLLDDPSLRQFFKHAVEEKEETYRPLIARCKELTGDEPTFITAAFTSFGRPSDACYHMISSIAGRLAKGRTDRLFQMGASGKVKRREELEDKSKNRIISDFFMRFQRLWIDNMFKTASRHQHIDSRKDKPLNEYRDIHIDVVDAGYARL